MIGAIIGVVAIVLAAAGARIAYKQLLDTQGLARGQFILAVDQSLAPFESVRRKIAKGEPPSDEIELRRYIAAIERIGYLYKKGYLEEDAVRSCYGSRLKRLVNSTHPDYVAMILTQYQADRTGWHEFLWLWEHFQGSLKLRDVPQEIRKTHSGNPDDASSGPEPE